MSSTARKATPAKAAPAPAGDVGDVDQADELAARDETIAALKAELAEVKERDGERAELARALSALADEVERMKAGKGLVAVPTSDEPAPFLYWGRLASGEVIELQFPWVTHHHSEKFGRVRVESVWEKDPDHDTAAAAAA